MLTVILFLILALVFGYFATQNTQHITITVATYTLSSIPLYAAVGITLLIGLSFSWLVSLIDSFSVAMKLRGKEHKIKDANKTIQDLTKQVKELEIENARLRGQNETTVK